MLSASRSLRLLLITVLLMAGAASAARAEIVTGISDQREYFFDSPAFKALPVRHIRLVLPWDAGLRRGPWDIWLQRARETGLEAHVAFGHDDESNCPGQPCETPAPGRYRSALATFFAQNPSVKTVTPWNEPNHRSQPTFDRPAVAAGYYDTAVSLCPDCTVVAGDLLDDGALTGYLRSYQAALRGEPRIWGLHNYYDATYFESRGVDTMLRLTTGKLWLTETGGIVSFRPPHGNGLDYDESRAADAIRWLYTLSATRPRLSRMYLYQWEGTPDNPFDSGLLGYDSSPRPGYKVVADVLGPGGVASAAGTGAAPEGTAGAAYGPAGVGSSRLGRRLRFVRIAGKRVRFGRDTVTVALSCVVPNTSPRRCSGRVRVRGAGVSRSRRVSVRAGTTRNYRFRLGRRALRVLRARRKGAVAISLCTGRRCTRPVQVPLRARTRHR